jgi:CRP-like cAMP-binding protein
VEAYLASTDSARRVVNYRRGQVAFAQGDPANDVRYIQKGVISQETLAEMIGATRARVNFFMNKFRKLGLIEYNGGLKVNSSLLTIVLHD